MSSTCDKRRWRSLSRPLAPAYTYRLTGLALPALLIQLASMASPLWPHPLLALTTAGRPDPQHGGPRRLQTRKPLLLPRVRPGAHPRASPSTCPPSLAPMPAKVARSMQRLLPSWPVRRSGSAVRPDAADLRVKVFDWQGAMESPPPVDLMYYVIGSLSTEVLQQHEQDLILGCVCFGPLRVRVLWRSASTWREVAACGYMCGSLRAHVLSAPARDPPGTTPN